MREGSRHFLAQRLTALLLLPLVVWGGFALAALPGADHATVTGWIREPVNAVMLALLLMVGTIHGELGVRVVIEDYLAPGPLQRWLLGSLRPLSVFLMTLGLALLQRIVFGGGT